MAIAMPVEGGAPQVAQGVAAGRPPGRAACEGSPGAREQGRSPLRDHHGDEDDHTGEKAMRKEDSLPRFLEAVGVPRPRGRRRGGDGRGGSCGSAPIRCVRPPRSAKPPSGQGRAPLRAGAQAPPRRVMRCRARRRH